MNEPITSTSQQIQTFLTLWHENGRPQFERSRPTENYDTHSRKVAKDRMRYVSLDSANTGVFLVEKRTGFVYLANPRGNRGRYINTLDALIEQYTIANERQNDAEALLLRKSPRRPSNPALVDENKQRELLQALFACVLQLHRFWDTLRLFEKELGCDVDDLDTIVRNEWATGEPRTIEDLRPLLDRILMETVTIRARVASASSPTTTTEASA